MTDAARPPQTAVEFIDKHAEGLGWLLFAAMLVALVLVDDWVKGCR